jgi:hypothetical protein
MKTPAHRTKNLLDYFGWQGGTIHQLAKETGIDVGTLLHVIPTNIPFEYTMGLTARTMGLESRRKLAIERRGNMFFWLGVANADKENK